MKHTLNKFTGAGKYGCRGSSIKTRIETLLSHAITFYIQVVVAEVVPLKQGLKHFSFIAISIAFESCRGSSIKTRIETLLLLLEAGQKHSVAEVVPLKQGLKLVRGGADFSRINRLQR